MLARGPESITEPQAVLFSGGRDSTLVACKLMLRGIPVVLYSANSGASLHRGLLQFRVSELRERFGELIVDHVIDDISGTFHDIAIRDIEQDILKYKKNLVLLGEKLAIHVHVAKLCAERGISKVSDGVVTYQQEFPEQKEVALDFLREFMRTYGIEYDSPIYEIESEDEVKYGLLRLGLCTKSLEGISLFADSSTEPSAEGVLAYLEEKEPLAHEILAFLMGTLPRTPASQQRTLGAL